MPPPNGSASANSRGPGFKSGWDGGGHVAGDNAAPRPSATLLGCDARAPEPVVAAANQRDRGGGDLRPLRGQRARTRRQSCPQPRVGGLARLFPDTLEGRSQRDLL